MLHQSIVKFYSLKEKRLCTNLYEWLYLVVPKTNHKVGQQYKLLIKYRHTKRNQFLRRMKTNVMWLCCTNEFPTLLLGCKKSILRFCTIIAETINNYHYTDPVFYLLVSRSLVGYEVHLCRGDLINVSNHCWDQAQWAMCKIE